ncbi:MAG: hypothetical protein R3A80_08780 [Bdellovibrionota bacterium]
MKNLKTNLLLAALIGLNALAGESPFEVDPLGPETFNKSQLLCVDKNHDIVLTATLTQHKEDFAHYKGEGAAEYTFEGKKHSGAAYKKTNYELRYGIRGDLKMSHDMLGELFTPLTVEVGYNIYGPNHYFTPESSLNFYGKITTPSGPRLVGTVIPVACRIIQAYSFTQQPKGENLN